MSYSKFKVFVDACRDVRKLREEYNYESCWFKCYKWIYVHDDVDPETVKCPGNVYFIGKNEVIYICDRYKANQECGDKDCNSCAWNKQYVDLANKLTKARQQRNQAFRNLFVRMK